MKGTTPVLVLIETDRADISGHWFQASRRLAADAIRRRHPVLLITPGGISTAAASGAYHGGLRVIDVPAGLRARALWPLSRMTRRTAVIAARLAPHRSFPHQMTMLARCLGEAAALRTATTLAGAERVAVLLSASEGLHTLTAVLGGGVHVRVVHELYTSEDRLLRRVGALSAPAASRVTVVTPTPAIRDQLAARFPNLRIVDRPFALADAEPALTEPERLTARNELGLGADDVAVCLIGGWWPHKDLGTVATAMTLLQHPIHLLIAGSHVDPQVLHRIESAPQVHVHTWIGHLPRAQIRQAYAAADATIVARQPGIGKESGLVADAAILRVPMIISEHDPATTTALTGQPWIRTFPAANPVALAAAIDQLRTQRLPRPDTQAPDAVGLRGTATTLNDYVDLHRQLSVLAERSTSWSYR